MRNEVLFSIQNHPSALSSRSFDWRRGDGFPSPSGINPDSSPGLMRHWAIWSQGSSLSVSWSWWTELLLHSLSCMLFWTHSKPFHTSLILHLLFTAFGLLYIPQCPHPCMSDTFLTSLGHLHPRSLRKPFSDYTIEVSLHSWALCFTMS